MIKYFCDFCGTEVDSNGVKIEISFDVRVDTEAEEFCGKFYKTTTFYKLSCHPCAQPFLKLMRGQDEK